MSELRFLCSLLAALALLAVTPARADVEKHKIDPNHSTVLFKAKHLDTGYVYGRFLQLDGHLVYDEEDVDNSSVVFTVDADSVYTNQRKRDRHLKSPDFLNAKQFPKIRFESTEVSRVDDDTLRVKGRLSLHGQTRTLTTDVDLTGAAEGPQGNFHRGFTTRFTIDRMAWGIDHMPDSVNDEIELIVAVETIRLSKRSS
jgi:polyisoprenoid-binding protein YceI